VLGNARLEQTMVQQGVSDTVEGNLEMEIPRNDIIGMPYNLFLGRDAKKAPVLRNKANASPR